MSWMFGYEDAIWPKDLSNYVYNRSEHSTMLERKEGFMDKFNKNYDVRNLQEHLAKLTDPTKEINFPKTILPITSCQI